HDEGIASIEIQALTCDTLLDLADYYKNRLSAHWRSSSDASMHRALDSTLARANGLKELVLNRFWLEDGRGGYFALGTDRDHHGNLRPLAVRTSNMGHALHLLDADDPETARRRSMLIETLFTDE